VFVGEIVLAGGPSSSALLIDLEADCIPALGRDCGAQREAV